MKKLLISGGNGRFATYLKKYNEDYEILTPTADQMNVTNFNSVDDFISSNEPDVFIHSAALTWLSNPVALSVTPAVPTSLSSRSA